MATKYDLVLFIDHLYYCSCITHLVHVDFKSGVSVRASDLGLNSIRVPLRIYSCLVSLLSQIVHFLGNPWISLHFWKFQVPLLALLRVQSVIRALERVLLNDRLENLLVPALQVELMLRLLLVVFGFEERLDRQHIFFEARDVVLLV